MDAWNVVRPRVATGFVFPLRWISHKPLLEALSKAFCGVQFGEHDLAVGGDFENHADLVLFDRGPFELLAACAGIGEYLLGKLAVVGVALSDRPIAGDFKVWLHEVYWKPTKTTGLMEAN